MNEFLFEKKLDEIADELYILNQLIKQAVMVYARINNKPLEHFDEEGFSFESNFW